MYVEQIILTTYDF